MPQTLHAAPAKAAPRLPFRPALPRPAPRAFGAWLLLVAALVFTIVVVGGITRLTESGLSITEWNPISGVIPPLNHAEWMAEFNNYKHIPQYRAFNEGMTLAGFQHIFFWEYFHRLLARTFATALFAVLAIFWWRRAIPHGYGKRAGSIFLLGLMQGAVGWWMVKSGLQYRVEVSHICLATHLLCGLLIYSVLIWTALDLFALARDGGTRPARLPGLGAVALAILAFQLMMGAFTAGLRAGYAFASWPKMGSDWFPAGGWDAQLSTVGNIVYNPIAVQFVHRWWAWVVAVAVLMVAREAARRGARAPATAIAVALVAQILLGIATLLSGVALPIAVAHQAVATLLLGSLVWGAHAIGSRSSEQVL